MIVVVVLGLVAFGIWQGLRGGATGYRWASGWDADPAAHRRRRDGRRRLRRRPDRGPAADHRVVRFEQRQLAGGDGRAAGPARRPGAGGRGRSRRARMAGGDRVDRARAGVRRGHRLVPADRIVCGGRVLARGRRARAPGGGVRDHGRAVRGGRRAGRPGLGGRASTPPSRPWRRSPSGPSCCSSSPSVSSPTASTASPTPGPAGSERCGISRQQEQGPAGPGPAQRRRGGRGRGLRRDRGGTSFLCPRGDDVEPDRRVLGRLLGGAHLGRHRPASRRPRPAGPSGATTARRRRTDPARRLRPRRLATEAGHDRGSRRDGADPPGQRTGPLPASPPLSSTVRPGRSRRTGRGP